MEHVFPAQVVHVPVILRVLQHGELQQRQILRPGFPVVRPVVQLHALHGDGPLREARLRGEHLVDRMGPAVAMPGMDLVQPEYMPLPAVGEKVPGVAVAGPGGSRRPCRFQQRPPPRMEILVQIRADADVRILRNQFQGAVPRGVEPPGVEALLRHLRSRRPQPRHRVVRGAGVQHDDLVRLPHGRHPTLHKLAFVFAYGIDANLHGAPTLCFFFAKGGGGSRPRLPGVSG